jgi:predicted nuclease of predicted toxin-antitoxin system
LVANKPMQILANENFPGEAVDALRQNGHDVAWIREDTPGISDAQVLDRAQAQGRLLITFDKDFGELAFRSRLLASCGIILFRVSMPSSTHVARLVVAILEQRADWASHFSVIENDRIRMTPLPSLKSN